MNDKERHQIEDKVAKLEKEISDVASGVIAVALEKEAKQMNAAISGLKMMSTGISRVIAGMTGTYVPSNRKKSDNNL